MLALVPFNLHDHMRFHSHFPDVEKEAQRGQNPCLKAHKANIVVETGTPVV